MLIVLANYDKQETNMALIVVKFKISSAKLVDYVFGIYIYISQQSIRLKQYTTPTVTVKLDPLSGVTLTIKVIARTKWANQFLKLSPVLCSILNPNPKTIPTLFFSSLNMYYPT